MKTIEQACEAALDAVRRELAEADGSEVDTYCEFVDKFGGEIAGWEMRIQELSLEEDEDELP